MEASLIKTWNCSHTYSLCLQPLKQPLTTPLFWGQGDSAAPVTDWMEGGALYSANAEAHDHTQMFLKKKKIKTINIGKGELPSNSFT